MANPPIAESRELVSERLDDGGESVEFFLIPAMNVVGGEQIEGDDLYAEVITPGEKLVNLVGACPVAVGGGFESLFCPAPVAIQNQPHVTRVILSEKLAFE